MLNVTRSGSTIADLVASVRAVPRQVIPYAASTALTRTVKIAQQAEIAAMRTSFDRPTPYTLNATFVEPATKDKLSARIGVKANAASGTTPEHFLFPEVQGGPRREKRFEAAMRQAGFMHPGERALPGAGVQLDQYGNVSSRTITNIIRQAGTGKGARIFAGTVGRKQTRGLWQRDGRRLKPLFVFTMRQPAYTARFNFEAAAERSVRENFSNEFYRAAAALQARYA